jgi:hypothetical protein
MATRRGDVHKGEIFMRHNKTLFITILGYLFVLGIIVNSQETMGEKMEIVNKLNSKNEGMIFKGYELLVNDDGCVKLEYRNDSGIKDSLWNALRFLVPEPVMIKPVESETNSTADYLLYVMGDVRETRAIPYLLKNFHILGFQFSLANMGDEAVPIVINMLESGNDAEKQRALYVLKTMLAPRPKEIEVGYKDPVKGFSHKIIPNSYYGLYEASGEAREKIKQALKKQLYQAKSLSTNLRESILAAYKYVADEQDVKLLEEIARNDPYKRGGKTGKRFRMRERFPIREEAQKALNNIRAKKANAQIPQEDLRKSTTVQ